MLPRVLLLIASMTACTPPLRQQEIGTPFARFPGSALVLLPRTCTIERSVPARHFYGRIVDPEAPPKSIQVREALDAIMPAAPRVDGRPVSECEPLPDLGFRPQKILNELRATDSTLRMMRERGATHAVVIEIRTVVACARNDSLLLAHYAGISPLGVPTSVGMGMGVGSRELDGARIWSANDVCVEDEVTLSAFVFREDGAAVWALTRELAENEGPAWAVDRVIERVPVTMPSRPRS